MDDVNECVFHECEKYISRGNFYFFRINLPVTYYYYLRIAANSEKSASAWLTTIPYNKKITIHGHCPTTKRQFTPMQWEHRTTDSTRDSTPGKTHFPIMISPTGAFLGKTRKYIKEMKRRSALNKLPSPITQIISCIAVKRSSTHAHKFVRGVVG